MYFVFRCSDFLVSCVNVTPPGNQTLVKLLLYVKEAKDCYKTVISNFFQKTTHIYTQMHSNIPNKTDYNSDPAHLWSWVESWVQVDA